MSIIERVIGCIDYYFVLFKVSSTRDHFIPPLRSAISAILLAHLMILCAFCMLTKRYLFTRPNPPKLLDVNYKIHLFIHGAVYVLEMLTTSMATNSPFMVYHHLASLVIFILLGTDEESCSMITLTPFVLHNIYHYISGFPPIRIKVLLLYNLSLIVCSIYLFLIKRRRACLVLSLLFTNNILYALMYQDALNLFHSASMTSFLLVIIYILGKNSKVCQSMSLGASLK